jgi:nucleoside-diphosphate-sugar epimerase
MMAAAEHGVRRIVFSSSVFGMGWAHDPSAFVPLYLPLDEDHPMMPFETYGLSKQIGEDIGAMLARSTDISVVSLRFTNIPNDEVRAEFPLPAPTVTDPLTLVMWGYSFADDVADAHVLAVDADIEGHEAFLLAQNKTRFSESTAELVRANFGDHVEIRDGLEGNASVINTLKAQRMLGWVPLHDWTSE